MSNCPVCNGDRYVLERCCSGQMCGCQGQPAVMRNCIACNVLAKAEPQGLAAEYAPFVCYERDHPIRPWVNNPVLTRHLLERFLVAKAIVFRNPAAELRVRREFLDFLRQHLRVKSNVGYLDGGLSIDGVPIQVDENSHVPFYIYC